MTASALLTRMRRARGYSQAALARRSGIPRTAINAYERGHRTPTTSTLLRLAEACDLQVEMRPRPRIDEQANAQALIQVLDLAEMLPTHRRRRLEFPPLPHTRA